MEQIKVLLTEIKIKIYPNLSLAVVYTRKCMHQRILLQILRPVAVAEGAENEVDGEEEEDGEGGL